jgi:hypothetical protein
MLSAAVARTTSFRPPRSYTTLWDATALARSLSRTGTLVRGWGLGRWSAGIGILGSIAAVIALFVPRDGGDSGQPADAPPTTPTAAAMTSARDFFAGQYGDVWALLHPAEQELVTRERYIQCEERAGFPAALISLKPSGVFATSLNREGYPEHSVTIVQLRAKGRTPDGVETVRLQYQLLKSEGQWAVLLPDHEYAAYKAGRCPPQRTD